MNRNEREQALWHDAYMLAMSQDPSPAESSGWADAAVAAFRKRYPAEPVQPPAVWYDEPPFPMDGKSYPCWVEGDAVHGDVHWCTGTNEWWVWIVGSAFRHALAGRRVSPIVKPQDPPQ